MKTKRVAALICAGIMTAGTCMAVYAAPSDGASVSGNSIAKPVYIQEAQETQVAQVAEAPRYNREAEAVALAILATGIPQESWQAAEAEGKSIGEYMSNTIMEVPGLEEATPVGQGGGIIIDGQASNVTLSIQKPLLAHVNYAKSQAEALGGSVLNVVDIRTAASFGTATANFYMPGVTVGDNIQVYQYVNNQWASVNVAEVRDDHVVVDLTSVGIYAFIEVQ